MLKLTSFYSTFKSAQTDIVHVVKLLIKPIQYMNLYSLQAECKHCGFDLYTFFHLLLDCNKGNLLMRVMQLLLTILDCFKLLKKQIFSKCIVSSYSYISVAS